MRNASGVSGVDECASVTRGSINIEVVEMTVVDCELDGIEVVCVCLECTVGWQP